jgi:hypothetical protein
MSKQRKEAEKIIGNKSHSLLILEEKDNFIKHSPSEVCVLQDCNIGGQYLRVYYYHDNNLYFFTCKCGEFPVSGYIEEQIKPYVWKYVKI